MLLPQKKCGQKRTKNNHLPSFTKVISKSLLHLYSISPTIYNQLLRWFPFAKNLQTLNVSTEKLRKTLSYKTVACKMLVKSTPVIRRSRCYKCRKDNLKQSRKKVLKNINKLSFKQMKIYLKFSIRSIRKILSVYAQELVQTSAIPACYFLFIFLSKCKYFYKKSNFRGKSGCSNSVRHFFDHVPLFSK